MSQEIVCIFFLPSYITQLVLIVLLHVLLFIEFTQQTNLAIFENNISILFQGRFTCLCINETRLVQHS